MRKGFTLLELIIVIIIIGVLATLGFSQYVRVVEKGRTAEAKAILGSLRTAQEAYNLEYGTYGVVANLGVDAPAVADATHYFGYVCLAGAVGTCTATRSMAALKSPAGPMAYTISVDSTGVWSGTPGYF